MPIDDPTAFEAFYARTVVDLTAFVRRRTHPVNVEDVVAAVYETAWRRRADVPVTGPDGPGDGASHGPGAGHDPARAWLFGVARNQLLSTSRGHRRITELTIRLVSEAEVTVCDHAAGVSDRDDLRRAWAELAPAEQEVLSLHLLDEVDGRSAARLLGCTRAAYSMRLSRARRHLGRALARGTSDSPDRDHGTPNPHPAHEASRNTDHAHTR